MGFLTLGSFHYPLEGNNHHCGSHEDQNQHHVVKAFGYHVECFIGGVSDKEEVLSVAEGEYGGLHVGGAEEDVREGRQVQVVAEVVRGH